MEEKACKSYQFLKNLFDDNEIQKITVPSYQRAYSWEQKQLDQFIGDLIEMTSMSEKGYYFGHFIFEKSIDVFQVIDGQQRITTFILFLIACNRKIESNQFKHYIDKFSTVDYDDILFTKLKSNESTKNLVEHKTLSISRIEFALKYFEKQFDTNKLNSESIEKYINVLLNSHISVHLTEDKAVAVQIFELHNSRGVKLNTIEKVKAKLMKALYLNSEKDSRDQIINEIQKCFGEIYYLEEKTSLNSFRGNLTLDEILLLHLRVIDDGFKLSPKEPNIFNSPQKQGIREDNILKYIDDKLLVFSGVELIKYIQKLSKNFQKSVEFICVDIMKLDEFNSTFGDSIILDKNNTLSFLLLLKHSDKLESLVDAEKLQLIHLWEKLLFTRDFHEKYKRLWYTDNFEKLFFDLVTQKSAIDILKKIVKSGFRSDRLDNKDLQLVVKGYIIENREKVKTSAFFWHKEKMIYLLYKYEVDKLKSSRQEIRNILKHGASVEHILPQEWQWEWMKIDQKNVTKEAHQFNTEISKIINGMGNLLLLSPSENSSQSNSHPKEKNYPIIGESYQKHNDEKEKWNNHNNWKEIISERGEEIYSYLVEFIEK
jgi:hypothetical protein